MAPETRSTDTPLDEALFAEGERFAYFQAVRLLRRRARRLGLDPDRLRVRPRLALGFPETDIDQIERDVLRRAPVREPGTLSATGDADAGTEIVGPPAQLVRADLPRITVNFFGLYGVSSPLPNFYTEDLIDEEREGRTGTREFLDIVHYAVYPLLYDGWVKYRPAMRVVEEGDTGMLDNLYAFVGLNDRTMRGEKRPGVDDLLRYVGLFAQRPHSALGLQTLLADAFTPAEVEVVSCVESWLPIPGDQRLVLGERRHALGVECYLGEQSRDANSALRIELRNLPLTLFDMLQPGRPQYERLQLLVRYYLNEPMEVGVLLALQSGEVASARVNGLRWNQLGRDTWLSPDPRTVLRPVRFTI
jgi:type VI secretion system protein ImpH